MPLQTLYTVSALSGFSHGSISSSNMHVLIAAVSAWLKMMG